MSNPIDTCLTCGETYKEPSRSCACSAASIAFYLARKVPTVTTAQFIKSQIDHPTHYQSEAGIEVIDVIEAFSLGFNLGNVVKYILRSPKKGATLQDLEKAKWYLERQIATLAATKAKS